MDFTMTREQTALLFTLYGQAPPPLVEDALSSFPWFQRRKRLKEIEDELVQRGVLENDGGGEPRMASGLADLLGVCFKADDALTLECGDNVTATAYFLGSAMTVAAAAGDAVSLFGLDGAGESSSWFVRALGEPTSDEGAQRFTIELDTGQLESLLALTSKEKSVEVEALCASHRWNCDDLSGALRMVGGDAPFLKTTTVRPGTPGMLVTKLRAGRGGAWLMKFVMLGALDVAELSWRSYSELLSAVRDFKGA